MARQLVKNLNHKELYGTLLVVGIGFVLWDTKLLYPLRILVTFFHEISHALAAWLTGGEVESMQVMANEGGLAWTRGGNRFVTAFAGYFGSVLFGGLLLVVAARARREKLTAVVLGAFLMIISLWLVRPFVSFGFFFGLTTGALLIASGAYLDAVVNDFVLRAIGLTACFSVFQDFRILWQSSGGHSDASALAQITGAPEALWIVLWLALGLAVGGYLLLLSCQRDRGPRRRSPAVSSKS